MKKSLIYRLVPTLGVWLLALVPVAGWPAEIPDLDCVITPSAQADISSPVRGVLETVDVERTDTVTPGQSVATLEAGVERASVALALARAKIETGIRLGEVDLAFDQRRRQRLETLYTSKAASFEEKDKADRDSARSAWKLRQARDIYTLRQLELDKAREVLKQKTIVSPIGGVVVQRMKSPGEYVEDQPILRVARLDPLYVEVIVPMEMFGRVRPGMQADVFPEAGEDEPLRARVDLVDRMGDAASGTYGMRLTLPNPNNRLPAGVRCTVTVLPDLPLLPDPVVPEVPPATPKNTAPPSPETGRTAMSAPAAPLAPTPAAGEPALEPQGGCARIGPFGDRAEARRLYARLQEQGLNVTGREVVEQVPAGYLVAARPQSGSELSKALLERMRQAGLNDLMVLSRGAYAGRVAAGVYDGARRAEQRRDRLMALGFDAEVIRRTRPRWWLDVNGNPDSWTADALRQVPSEAGLTVSARVCPGLLTARNDPPQPTDP